MSKHVAYLTNADGFDPATLAEKSIAGGVLLQTGKRYGGGSDEGVSYAFDPEKFDGDAVTQWLADRKIKAENITLAEPGDFVEMEYAGISVGKHTASDGTKVDASEDYLSRLAANTNRLIDAGTLRPPQKLGHDPDQDKTKSLFPEGGDPALGWVRRLQMVKNRLVVNVGKVPAKFAGWVKDGLYRTRSLEIHPNYRGEGPAVVGVAWLGATRPADPTLPDCIPLADRSETVSVLFSEGDELNGGDPPTPGTPADGDATGNEPIQPTGGDDPPKTDGVDMTDEEKAALEAKAKAGDDAIAQLEEAKKQYVEGKVVDAIKDRHLLPEEKDTEIKRALTFAEFADAKGYVDDLFKRPQHPDKTTQLAHGEEPPKPDDEIKLEGEALLLSEADKMVAADKDLDYGDALILATRANPDAETQYYEEAYPVVGRIASPGRA